MEDLHQAQEGPLDVPAGELWGRQVYDTRGLLLGTIDSIATTLGGPRRAIVKPGRGRRRFVFVDLSAATFQGHAVVVPAAWAGALDGPVESSATFTWSGIARREA